MPKFNVLVTRWTTNVERATVVVEAEDEFQASDIAYDLCVDDGVEFTDSAIVDEEYRTQSVTEV